VAGVGAGSEPAWLKSTDDGGPLLATYHATGQVDVSQVGHLQGGVATGTSTAVEARSEAAAALRQITAADARGFFHHCGYRRTQRH
jgi:hypothetical protein